MAGSSTADGLAASRAGDGPRFFYDLASPECWLAAERLVEIVGSVPELVPVSAPALGIALDAFRCAEERSAYAESIAARARSQGLLEVRWPTAWPPDDDIGALAATYCRSIGKVAAFTLAACRQQYAGGRALDEDTVVLAGAACEIHPRALLAGIRTRGTAQALANANAEAARLRISALPALAAGGEIVELAAA